MTNLDQFESVFRAAAKPTFALAPPALSRVMILSDLPAEEAALFAGAVRGWLAHALGDERELTYDTVAGSAFASAKDVLDLVESRRPDLVVTYRNLHSDAWQWPFSLGEHLDVLCQAANTPVLVLPHPKAPESGDAYAHVLKDTDRVMALTDHLAGDDHLINTAIALTQSGGTLYLAHLEDQRVFDRYLAVIAKIPQLDTDTARATIAEQLLKEPRDYIRSVREVVQAADVALTIEKRVQMGRQLADYRAVIEAEQIDLLVIDAKDEDQLAMHGLAYPLAIELRQLPLLLV